MATVTPTTFLGRQVIAYGDGWPAADHAEAMACRDLEERLEHGLALYRLVMKRSDDVGRRLAATGAVYDLPSAKEVERLLTSWLAPAGAALRAIADAEKAGYTVIGAAEFRETVQDVRVSLSIPVERAAAQAERIAREGLGCGGKTTEELRRELRDRLGA